MPKDYSYLKINYIESDEGFDGFLVTERFGWTAANASGPHTQEESETNHIIESHEWSESEDLRSLRQLLWLVGRFACERRGINRDRLNEVLRSAADAEEVASCD